jgi:hypothetical protein
MSKIDLSPSKLDLRGVPAGDDIAIVVRFKDSDGNPQDTSGATLSAQVRASAVADDIELSASVSAITDGSDGEWSVLFSGTDTRTVLGTANTWTGVWDLEITLSGQSNPRTVLGGRFQIESDVTRV